MKRILGTIILGLSALLLTGCDDRNNVEKTLFDQCSAVNKLSCESEYSSTLSSLNCGGNVCNPKETPFSKSMDVFKIDDRMFKLRHPEMKSISEIYFESTGRNLYVGAVSTGSTTDEVKKVNNQYVLSPQMYDELISAVKTCNRATISATQFTMGSTLTPEEYDNVMKIIMECKKFQLEQAINQKAQ